MTPCFTIWKARRWVFWMCNAGCVAMKKWARAGAICPSSKKRVTNGCTASAQRALCKGKAAAGVAPVEWMLLTNLPVESADAALEKIQWYCLRFQIEVYHRTLKSGCKIEERQLGSAERIESCLSIDLLVAWRIVHLTKLGRETPQVPCTVFFEQAQWQAVFFFSTRRLPPKEPPALRTIMLMVAQLGGFLGRKSDGQPGAKSMWLGLQRMDDLAEMWRAIKSMKPASLLALLDSS